MLEASRAACAVSRIVATSRRTAGVAAGAEAAGVSPASIDGLEYCDRDPDVIPHTHTHIVTIRLPFRLRPRTVYKHPPQSERVRQSEDCALCAYVHRGWFVPRAALLIPY